MFQLWGKLAENWLRESSAIHTSILTSNPTKNIIMASAQKIATHWHWLEKCHEKNKASRLQSWVGPILLARICVFNGDLAILFGGFLSIATDGWGHSVGAKVGKIFVRTKNIRCMRGKYLVMFADELHFIAPCLLSV